MELYFKIFLQGSPFVIFVTYLFMLKRRIRNIYYVQLLVPMTLYFIAIMFCKRIFIDEYDEYSLTYHIWFVNALFSGWAFYLFLRKYDDDILEIKIRKWYKNICKNKNFKYIRSDKESFLEAIRYIKIRINELIPFENLKYEIYYNKKEFYKDIIYITVSKIFIEKELLKDVKIFLKDKTISDDKISILWNFYDEVLYYVCENDLAFYWGTSYKNDVLKKIWLERYEKTNKI